MKKFFLSFALGAVLLLASPVVSLAQTAPAPAAADQAQTESAQESPTFRSASSFGYISPVSGNLTGFINRLINFALGIVGAILLATFIYGGGSWMIASDPKEVQAAKATLKNAVIGMAIVTLSYTIVTAIFTIGNQVIAPIPAASDAETETPTPPATGG